MQGREPQLSGNMLTYFQAQRNQQTPAWRFAKAAYDFTMSARPSNSDYAPINNLQTNLSALYRLLDSLTSAAGNETTLRTIDSLYTLVGVKEEEKKSLLLGLRNLEKNNLVSVLAQIQALPETEVYQKNLKEIYHWYARYASGDTLDVQTLGILRGIAQQDPSLGGDAVREARRWLPMEEQRQFAGYEVDAGSIEFHAEQHTVEVRASSEQDWKIAPNPARDRIFVKGLSEPLSRWELWDMTGKRLRQNTSGTWASTGEFIGDLSPGVYFLHLATPSKTEILRFLKQ